MKRHTAEKPTRVVDPPSALRFCAALAVCAASPLTTTHGQGPVQLGKGTGCALVWPRPSAYLLLTTLGFADDPMQMPKTT